MTRFVDKRFIIKIAQAPPPSDPLAGLLGGGAPPMGGPPGAIPTAPMGWPPGPPGTMPMSTEPQRTEIYEPLNSINDVLYDANITDDVEGMVDKDASELALKIWKDYGGDELGDVEKFKIGERIKKKFINPEEGDKEREDTEDSKWRRLPKDKYITDIFPLDELVKVIGGLILGTVKNMAKQQGAGGAAPPGGMPPIAQILNKWIKISYNLDKINPYLVDLLILSNTNQKFSAKKEDSEDSLESQIAHNISSAINYRGWDSNDYIPDFKLAEWVMDYKPPMFDGKHYGEGLSLREILNIFKK